MMVVVAQCIGFLVYSQTFIGSILISFSCDRYCVFEPFLGSIHTNWLCGVTLR